MKFLTTDYESMFNTLVKLKMDFTLSMSTYTTIITVDGKKFTFLQNYHNKQTFAHFQKIKAHLKQFIPPVVKKDELTYYNQNFERSGYYGNVTNIDLKSAYITILYNEGLLTKKLFADANALPKDERLACVGMLAARRETFTFRAGSPVSSFPERSPYENFFFLAVARTASVIEGARKYIAPRFLFSWVDGFYFIPDPERERTVCTYLDSLALPYTVERLTDFMVSIGEETTRVSFYKPEQAKPKKFNIPNSTSQMQTIIYKHLLTQNFKHGKQESKIIRSV
jgi:hypothetical protein